MDLVIRGHGAAKCAIDIALHDLVGKVAGSPVHELLGLSADLPPTDFTIGIDEPAVVAERAARAAAFPALKIKVGGTEDLATLEAVRGVFAGPIRVDANTGWEPEDALATAAATSSGSASSSSSSRSRLGGSTSFDGSRSGRRCRSSPTRVASSSRTSTGSSGSWTGST